MLRYFAIVLAACTAAPATPSDGSPDGKADGSGSGSDTAAPTSPVGTNLTGIVDYSAEWSFVDAFKASRAWISGSSAAWDDGRALDLDEHGWVRSLQAGQIARTLVLPESAHPAGDYVVLYDGAGTLTYSGSGTRDAARSTPGRDVVRVGASGPVIVNITATTAGNPVRNIRFLMPGGVCAADKFRYCDDAQPCGTGACNSFEDVYATQIFHPTFLSRVRAYGTLRFMDWLETNNSSVTDHPTAVTDARWSQHGVPIEILIELSNRLRANAWLTVPHLATDGYVEAVANLVHDRLAPGLRVYVEYSNEVWNGIFTQGTYAEQRGVALGLATSPFEARLRFQSQRSVEIFRIFEDVFTGAARARLVRVLAAQAANSWTSSVLLSHGNAADHTDALAIAPYFGGSLGSPGEAARVGAMDLDGLFDELEQDAVPTAIGWVTSQAAEATQHGVSLIAYEGGNHLAGFQGVENNTAVNALFDAANRDPRMANLYATYLEGWKQQGGELFVHFVNCFAPSKWGRWGALEYLEQPRAEAPKYDAIHTFIETYTAWW
jgi:hypothetical protein